MRLDGIQRGEGDCSLVFNNRGCLFPRSVGCFTRGGRMVSAFYLLGQ